MEERRSQPKHQLGAALTLFVLTAFTAIVMLLTALTVWLTYLTDSLIAATLIIGGFSAVLALVIYHLSIRHAVAQLHEELHTVYEMARIAHSGYKWVTEKLALFFEPRAK